MYVDEYFDHHVEVTYITAHTNHQLGDVELPYLPLPKGVQEEVALKVSKGIPTERILELFHYLSTFLITPCMYVSLDVRENVGNRIRRQNFDQAVSRKHFLSNQDICNVRTSVLDRQIKRHENDALSVGILVHELRQEPFDPILIYKPQGITIWKSIPHLSKIILFWQQT